MKQEETEFAVGSAVDVWFQMHGAHSFAERWDSRRRDSSKKRDLTLGEALQEGARLGSLFFTLFAPVAG